MSFCIFAIASLYYCVLCLCRPLGTEDIKQPGCSHVCLCICESICLCLSVRFSSLYFPNGLIYLNKTHHTYSSQGSHDTGDIFEVVRSKVGHRNFVNSIAPEPLKGFELKRILQLVYKIIRFSTSWVHMSRSQKHFLAEAFIPIDSLPSTSIQLISIYLAKFSRNKKYFFNRNLAVI